MAGARQKVSDAVCPGIEQRDQRTQNKDFSIERTRSLVCPLGQSAAYICTFSHTDNPDENLNPIIQVLNFLNPRNHTLESENQRHFDFQVYKYTYINQFFEAGRFPRPLFLIPRKSRLFSVPEKR